ncbi:hypothetical protein D3C86_2092950 [compost metagenome]
MKVDFTLPADEEELTLPAPGPAEERTAVVPQAAPAPDAIEAFQPLDFKQAARQIQSTMKE